jgi:hypothetical protein
MKILFLIAATILAWRLWRRWKLFSGRQATAKSLALMFIAANEAGMTHHEFCARIGFLYRIDPNECVRILTVTQKDGDEDGVKLARFLLLEIWFAAKLLPNIERLSSHNLGHWVEKMRASGTRFQRRRSAIGYPCTHVPLIFFLVGINTDP